MQMDNMNDKYDKLPEPTESVSIEGVGIFAGLEFEETCYQDGCKKCQARSVTCLRHCRELTGHLSGHWIKSKTQAQAQDIVEIRKRIIAILEDHLSVTDEWGGTKLANWQWGNSVQVNGIDEAADAILVEMSHGK